MSRSGLILSLCICLSSTCYLSSASAYEFIPLGDLPGGIFLSKANSVSADGSVVVGVGRTDTSSEVSLEAFIWDATNGMVGLGYMPGGTLRTNATAVSADGSIVAGVGNSSSGTEAFIWDSINGMVGLGDLPGNTFLSTAFGISADGSIVVGVSKSSDIYFGNEAFIWDATNGMVGLGELPGGDYYSAAVDVSADGSVLTGTSTSGTLPSREAFIWDAANGMVGLGDLPGGDYYSEARGISSDGKVIVGYSNSSSGNEAFRWDATNGMVGLGDLPGGIFFSQAVAASADGSVIVGNSQGEDGTTVAVYWDSNNGIQDLKTVLEQQGGLDLTGWRLIATDISADGKTIVGYGFRADVNSEAWIAKLGPALSEVSMVITGGSNQECNTPNGNTVQLTAVVKGDDPTLITWTVDDTVVGYGDNIDLTLGLGQHVLTMDVVTANNLTGSATETINISDTVAPQLVANIVDVKSGDQLAQILTNRKVSPSIIVTDACDPNPLVKAVAGIPTSSGDEFFVDKSRKYTSVRTDSDVDTFELSVTATDASGNTATELLELDIITR